MPSNPSRSIECASRSSAASRAPSSSENQWRTRLFNAGATTRTSVGMSPACSTTSAWSASLSSVSFAIARIRKRPPAVLSRGVMSASSAPPLRCSSANGESSVSPRLTTVLAAVRSVSATRYVTPLREGGSLPGLVEADDDGLYVVKFRGAGQGPRALVAEWLAGELARTVGLTVPDLVGIEIDPALGDAEPDEEIHDLVGKSGGLNFGMDFLPGALTFNPAIDRVADADWAAAVVWLDGLITNPDRSPKNPNLLTWHGRTWLIDHGASLYIHHTWR